MYKDSRDKVSDDFIEQGLKGGCYCIDCNYFKSNSRDFNDKTGTCVYYDKKCVNADPACTKFVEYRNRS